MIVEIVSIREEHIASYNQVVASGARERKWLGMFEGFPLETTCQFLMMDAESLVKRER